MLKLFLWFRYLCKRKIVLLSIAAVALSVTLMITVDSLFTGYMNALQEITAAESGELFFYPSKRGFTGIENYSDFLDELEKHTEIRATAPWDFGAGLLWVEGGDVRGVSVYYIDPEREKNFSNWDEKFLRQTDTFDFSVPGDEKASGAWIGVNIIAEPNELTDKYDRKDVSKFISNRVVLTTSGDDKKRKAQKLKVSDVVFSKSFLGDKTLYLPYEMKQEIEKTSIKPNAAYFIKVRLDDPSNFYEVANIIRSEWGKYAVEKMNIDPAMVPLLSIQSQQQWYGEIFEDLNNQKNIMLLVFGVICSGAVLLIFCIFYMIVTSKQKDIAIIKSCGSSSFSTAMIFTGFGLVVGVIGSAIGVVGGLLITQNANILEEWVRIIFGMKLWRTSAFGIADIPDVVHWPAVPFFIIVAVMACLIGVMIPSIIAARTCPGKILRYELY